MRTYSSWSDLLKRAQALGLSTEMAVRYAADHDRLFGHHRFNQALATSEDWAWRTLRRRLRHAWCAIRSHADWVSFSKSPEHRLFHMSLGSTWEMFAPDDDGNNHWVRMAKAGSWNHLWAAADRHAWPPSRVFPSSIARSSSQARRQKRSEIRLQKALSTCGLRGVAWPGDQPSSPEHLDRIVEVLLEAQHLLQARTGLGGPLLGLGGRLHVSLDAHIPASGAEAYFCWSERSPLPSHARKTGMSSTRSPAHGWSGERNGRITRFTMVLSLKAGLTSLAHEWFHALDAVLAWEAGHSGRNGVSEQWSTITSLTPVGHIPPTDLVHEAVGAMNRLTQAVVEGPMSEEQFAAAQDDARKDWAARLRSGYHHRVYDGTFNDEEQDLQNNVWDRSVSIARWQEAVKQWMVKAGCWFVEDPGAAYQYRWTMGVALSRVQQCLLHEKTFPHPPGQPFWTAVHDHLEQTQKDFSLRAAMEGYSRQPHEMLAHAFESSFGRSDLLIVERCSGEASVLYPTIVDAAHHAPAWTTMFKAIKPWWDDLCAACSSAVNSGVKEGL